MGIIVREMVIVRENESGEFNGLSFSSIAADARKVLMQNPSAKVVPADMYILAGEDVDRFYVTGNTLIFEEKIMACCTIYFKSMSDDRNTASGLVLIEADALARLVRGNVYQWGENRATIEFDESRWQELKAICDKTDSVVGYALH